MKNATYDIKCYQLALEFLRDCNPPLSDDMQEHHADMMACDIQRVIETYIEELGE
jgi:hypothetical protein